jgi:hypothetical protein
MISQREGKMRGRNKTWKPQTPRKSKVLKSDSNPNSVMYFLIPHIVPIYRVIISVSNIQSFGPKL